MRKKTSLFLLIFLTFIAVPNKVRADVTYLEKTIVSPSVIISATIGIPKMTLWGYGPANSVVEVTGTGVDQKTTSQSDGYYSFDLIYLHDSMSFPELCITAVDLDGRVTPPTCIPPIEEGNYFYNVGPVILPPTISLGAPETNPGSQVSAQGTAIPNTEIVVKLAQGETGTTSFKLVSEVLAFYIPSYTVTSDSKGNYSFNMPIKPGRTWRVFAFNNYEGNPSPKSNTLVLKTMTTSAYMIKTSLTFLGSLFKWPGVILLELILILILAVIIFAIFKKNGKKKYSHKYVKNDQNYSNESKKYQEYLLKIRNVN